MTNINEDVDYEFVEKIKGFPALFKKNIAEYSNRDIVQNSWEGFSKEMGDIGVDVAKEWWQQLLRKYNCEKNFLHKEERSGSAAPSKRERFNLYHTMRDMLAFSQNSRPSITNYKPHDDIENECSQPKQQANFYQYKMASGRSCRKQMDVDNTMKVIDDSIKRLQNMQNIRSNNNKNPNTAIGRLIKMELDQMSKHEADEKIRLIGERLLDQ